VMRSIDLREVVARLCALIVRDVGYQPEEVSAGERFLEWVERERGVPRAPLERRLLEALGKVAREPAFDLAFGTAITHLAADHLGYRLLNEVEAGALWRWLLGAKVSLSELRPLRLYKRVDRHSARGALRSLAALALQAGYRGLVVCVDNLDALLERDPDTGRLRYTRGLRDEAYEAIRELIDDVDEGRASLYLFAGRRTVLEDEKAGISSYEALRLRLVPEVRANHFNPYTDVVDLDQARALGYMSAADLQDLAARAAALAPAIRGLAAGLAPPEVPPSSGEVRKVVLEGITRGG
jgi:bacteriophage exclusion system BrxC/D-like protein